MNGVMKYMIDMDDMIGKKFGKLTVLERVPKPDHLKSKGKYYKCICDCGDNEVIRLKSDLNFRDNHSCGCVFSNLLSERNKIVKKKYNTFKIDGDFGIGYTSKGEEFYFDLEDYDLIKEYCWRIGNRGYVMCTIQLTDEDRIEMNSNRKDGKYDLLMHRLVTKCPKDMSVDHIDGIETRNNNRKYNLRICTHQENLCNYPIPKNNTSGKTGVYWDNTHSVWKACITCKNERINLGSYSRFEDAVDAREKAEIDYFGEFRNKQY